MPDYPSNWNIHEVPTCKNCQGEIPHKHITTGSGENIVHYYLPEAFISDGVDGWHDYDCGGE